MMINNPISRRWGVLIVLVTAMAVRLAALAVVSAATTPWDDSAQYINLATSLAEGHGCQLKEGNFWPGKPTIIRAPGWPLLLSVPFKVIPREWRWQTARAMAVAVDVLNAILIMLLTRVIGGSRLAAMLAGLLYALNPVSAALAAQAGSEPCGITFLLLFLLLGVRGRSQHGGGHFTTVPGIIWTSEYGHLEGGCPQPPHASFARTAVEDARPPGKVIRESLRYLLPGLMLGLACLVRANWLAIAGCFGLAFCWVNRRQWRRAIGQMAVFGIAVMIPLTPWLVRNYQVFGHFPVLGAGGGETFFGGNNALAADPHSPMWGYIVQPGGIPGAVPLVVLAATMNEYEVDRYWMGQGWTWLKDNPGKIPALVVGKLRRAFVPIPYNSRSPMVWAASAYRAFLYVATLIGFIMMARRQYGSATDRQWRCPRQDDDPDSHALSGSAAKSGRLFCQMNGDIWLLFGSVSVATVMTTMLFCGVMRYVVGFDVLLLVPAGMVVGEFCRGAQWRWFHPRLEHEENKQ